SDVVLSDSDGDSGFEVAVYDSNGDEIANSPYTSDSNGDVTIPSGDQTADESYTFELVAGTADDSDDITVDSGAASSTDATVDPATRTADLPSGVASNDATATLEFQDSDENLASAATPDQDFVQYGLESSAGSSTVDLTLNDDTSGSGDGSAAVLVTQPEDDNDNEQAYVVEGYADGDGQDVDVDYTGSMRSTDSLDDEDVTVGYDFYGAYTEFDTEDSSTDNFMLHLPGSQATAGMAVTGADGELSASGGGSASATTQTATGFPDSAALDSEVSGSDRDQNMILVGGPAVNSLTEELAQENKTWTRDQYDEDTWVLDLVDGFREGTHALVVAGHSADDTRAASSYISNYADHEDELAGETTVNMTTSSSSQ
ncbi:MAG: hypothetical protein BRC27_01075, partial [Nanohaloarchaea archaeon SW_10_44_10]